MTVEQTRKHVLNIIAPNDSIFAKLGHIFFHKLKQGIEIILRIFQETEQKLDLAVACTAAHTLNRRVKERGSVGKRLDRIREREILIVVSVEADQFVRSLDYLHIFLCVVRGVLWIERAVAVDEINDVNACFNQHFKRLLDLIRA